MALVAKAEVTATSTWRPGQLVDVDVKNCKYRDETGWEVQSVDASGSRVIVTNGRHTISVHYDNVTARSEDAPSLVLALPRGPPPEVTDESQAQSVDKLAGLIRHSYGDLGDHIAIPTLWRQLPGGGAGQIRLVKNSGKPEDALRHFKDLRERNLTVEFFNPDFPQEAEYGHIVLVYCDILVWCPMWYVWPWCAACRKFHFPAHGAWSHRVSKKHQSQLRWY
jgi:hypothetical protein